MKKRNIIEDDASVEIPSVSFEDKYLLNRQTAYNRDLIMESRKCGCFHCGSIFDKAAINEWLEEKEGNDTALCPYCREDAVIVGTDKLPVSTALLSMLYMKWFSSEYEEAEKSATEMPSFSDYDDYLRKGVPFRFRKEGAEIIGEIGLWIDAVFDSAWNEEFDDDIPVNEGDLGRSDFGGVVSIRTGYDDGGRSICEFIDDSGNVLPYQPWSGGEEDLLLKLSEKYGDELKGIICSGGFGDRMRIFVKK